MGAYLPEIEPTPEEADQFDKWDNIMRARQREKYAKQRHAGIVSRQIKHTAHTRKVQRIPVNIDYIIPGVCLTHIARGTGMRLESLSRLFNPQEGKSISPRLNTCRLIADFLNISLDDLAQILEERSGQ